MSQSCDKADIVIRLLAHWLIIIDRAYIKLQRIPILIQEGQSLLNSLGGNIDSILIVF